MQYIKHSAKKKLFYVYYYYYSIVIVTHNHLCAVSSFDPSPKLPPLLTKYLDDINSKLFSTELSNLVSKK